MYITSLLPFVLLITLFVCLGSLLGRTLPVYRKLLLQLLTQKGYSPELEGLRGLLAVSVVIHHCVSWRSLLEQGSWEIHGANWGFNTQLGTYAVTMFFFLTGFLFWSKLINSEKVSFARFMYSRIWRLSPAYLGGALFLFVLVAVFSRFELHGSFGSLLRAMVEWSMFSVAGTPVLNGFAETNRLWVVTWSLRLEIVFYLLIPFVLWFSKTIWKTLLFIALCCMLLKASLFVEPNHWHFPFFYLLQAVVRFICFSFSVGIVTAHLVRIEAVRRLARSAWAAPVALV